MSVDNISGITELSSLQMSADAQNSLISSVGQDSGNSQSVSTDSSGYNHVQMHALLQSIVQSLNLNGINFPVPGVNG